MITEDDRRRLVETCTRRRDAGLAAVHAEFERDVAMIESLSSQHQVPRLPPAVSKTETYREAAAKYLQVHGNLPHGITAVCRGIGAPPSAGPRIFDDPRFVVVGTKKVRCA